MLRPLQKRNSDFLIFETGPPMLGLTVAECALRVFWQHAESALAEGKEKLTAVESAIRMEREQQALVLVRIVQELDAMGRSLPEPSAAQQKVRGLLRS
eukprot:COSAG02_NODE_28297_length_592_cov_0.841785_2_plen_97_part_01